MARRMRSISISRARGVSLGELLVVIVIATAIGITFIPNIVDVRFGATQAAQKSNESSLIPRISAAARHNYTRSEAQVPGSKIGLREYSCLAGNNVAKLLDNKEFVGGYGGMWFRNPDGTPDYTRYWALSGPEDIPQGEMGICTATRDGKSETFFLVGCRPSGTCGCEDYISDCETF